VLLALVLGGWIGASGMVEEARQRVQQAREVLAALQADGEATLADSGAAIGDANGDAGTGPAGDAVADSGDRDTIGAPSTRSSDLAAEDATESATEGSRLAASTKPDAEGGDSGSIAGSIASTDPTAQAVEETAERIPRIALARVAPQVPKAESGALPELTLDDGEPIAELLQLWGYEPDQAADCTSIRALGLACERSRERWSDLRLFDRPAALKLTIDGQQRYALITGIDDEYAVVQGGDTQRRVPIADLDERWSGDLVMLWRLPPGGAEMVGPGSVGETVQWLRERLAALPDATLTEATGQRYDGALQAAVREFQSGRGLAVDGIAGPRTLILLNNALADSELPRLSQSQTP
jgi:general secretion pathway protein A